MSLDKNIEPEPLSRREREKLAHRRDILDAATRVFARRGFANATLDEIAREAEFSKGTLYLYFTNKEDIIYNILKYKAEVMKRALVESLDGTSTLKEELRALYREYAELSFKEEDFFKLIMALHVMEYKPLSEEKAGEFMEYHEYIIDSIGNRVLEAMRAGELRDISPGSITGIILGSLHNMMYMRWGCETLESLYKAVDIFIDMIFNGIAKERETSQ